MKKRNILLFSIIAIFLLAPFCQAQEGQSSFEKKLFLNFGIIADDTFSFDPLYWGAGIELDLFFGENIYVAPELNLIGYGFEFDVFLLEPAVLINFRFDDFFVGAGLQKFFVIGSGNYNATIDPMLKLNAGFIGENIKLRIFLITPFDPFFDGMLIGAQLGIGF